MDLSVAITLLCSAPGLKSCCVILLGQYCNEASECISDELINPENFSFSFLALWTHLKHMRCSNEQSLLRHLHYQNIACCKQALYWLIHSSSSTGLSNWYFMGHIPPPCSLPSRAKKLTSQCELVAIYNSKLKLFYDSFPY